MGDPEEAQDRVTELLNSTKSVLLLVINIFETDSVKEKQNGLIADIIKNVI